jgi:glycosyltransferase involved in cell wall biosynthesis
MRLDERLAARLRRARGRLQGVRGNLDGYDDGQLRGWAAGRGPDPLRIGAFGAGGLIAEASANVFRGDLAAAGIGNGHHAFTITLDAVARAAIRTGGGTVEVRTLGPRPVVLGRINIDGRSGGAAAARGPVPPQDALRRHLFGAVHRLGGLLAAAEADPAPAPGPLSAHQGLTMDRDLLPPGQDQGQDRAGDGIAALLPAPMTAYADYVRYRYKLDRTFDIHADPDAATHFLQWYLAGYSTMRGGLRVPMSAAMIAWYNAPVMIGGKRHSLTRATWQFLVNLPGLMQGIDPDNRDWLEAAVYWWSVEQAHAMHVEDCLVPDSYAALLAEVPPEWQGRSFAPSRFMLRLRTRTDALVDLDPAQEGGRRRLALAVVVMAAQRPDYLRYLPPATLAAVLDDSAGESPLAAFLREMGADPPCPVTAARHAAAMAHAGFDTATRQFLTLTPPGHRFEAARLPAVTGERVDVQIIGPFEKASGLGQATRQSAAALAHAGVSVNCVDFDLDNPAPEGFSRVGALAGYRPARVNLLHLNGESVPLAFAYQPDVFSGAYNIGYFFWELDTPAACHHLSLQMLDEIWVATRYGVSIFARHAPCPVSNVGMAVEAMPVIDRAAARAYAENRLGIGPRDFVFFVAFDSFSFVQRKNPVGTLQAFALAFPDDPDVRLVIKTQNRRKVRDPAQMEIWEKVDRLIAADPRIILIDETLSYEDLLRLKKGCDAYVSLHKSEGWGFGMIEAMNIGVPVLATAYSGNMDFCSGDTAWLVAYDEVELDQNDYIFVIPGQKWAEPDVTDAARQMRALRADPALAARRTEAAQKNVRENFSAAAIGARYKARLDAILAHPYRPHDALWQWTAGFDAQALLAAFARTDQSPEPGIVRNFIGTRIEPAVFPQVLTALAGRVEPVPAPGNWHADIAEWAAALRTVDLAARAGQQTYRIVEAGCGWGCWITNMGVAARARGLDVDLIGIEGEAGHLENARRTLALNGFGTDGVALHHGIAGPHRGKAIFPHGEGTWGGAAIFDPAPDVLARAEGDPAVQVLDCLTLADLSGGRPVDLLHIDIQGAEVDFVTGNAADMDAHVKRVLIGTHGRAIETRLGLHFRAAGWRLEMARPAVTVDRNGRQELEIDGVQMWANPAFAAQEVR